MMRELETRRLMESVERLPERQRRVLVRRYGLDGEKPATLADLSEELAVSRERIRQLQREAERALRNEWESDRNSRQPLSPAVAPVCRGNASESRIRQSKARRQR